MARDWPFFGTFIDDIEMVLAKADMGIFKVYSQLCSEHHDALFPLLNDEFQRAREAILALRG